MIGWTKRDLLEDPASLDTFQIHTIPGILLFEKKAGTEIMESVAQ
jgi:hypothetical protein